MKQSITNDIDFTPKILNSCLKKSSNIWHLYCYNFPYFYPACNLTAFLLIITYLSVLVQCLQFKLCDQFPHSFLYREAIVDHQGDFIIHRGNGDCELVGHLKQIKNYM